MTNNPAKTGSTWAPDRWHAYEERYPDTPQIDAAASRQNAEFINIWKSAIGDKHLPECCTRAAGERLFVLVRGLFGNLMPGNFVAVRDHLLAAGGHAIRTTTRAAATVEEQASILAAEAHDAASDRERFVFLCQSKGGLDALWALTHDDELRSRTAGVILMQTPSGPSEVLESVIAGKHSESLSNRAAKTTEQLQRAVLTIPGLNRGTRQLIAPELQRIVGELRARLQKRPFGFPVLSVATWSVHATSWVDSFHRRLGEIRPGAAHDGQFYLEDQLWPEFEQLLLGEIDHAQSVMGGNGFDPVPLWTGLIRLHYALSATTAYS